MKKWVLRLPKDLDEKLTEYAKKEELSKNQVVKIAIKKLLKERKNTS